MLDGVEIWTQSRTLIQNIHIVDVQKVCGYLGTVSWSVILFEYCVSIVS